MKQRKEIWISREGGQCIKSGKWKIDWKSRGSTLKKKSIYSTLGCNLISGESPIQTSNSFSRFGLNFYWTISDLQKNDILTKFFKQDFFQKRNCFWFSHGFWYENKYPLFKILIIFQIVWEKDFETFKKKKESILLKSLCLLFCIFFLFSIPYQLLLN